MVVLINLNVDTIYKTKDLQVDSKISILIEHSKILHNIAMKAGDIVTSAEEFQLLNRVIQFTMSKKNIKYRKV